STRPLPLCRLPSTRPILSRLSINRFLSGAPRGSFTRRLCRFSLRIPLRPTCSKESRMARSDRLPSLPLAAALVVVCGLCSGLVPLAAAQDTPPPPGPGAPAKPAEKPDFPPFAEVSKDFTQVVSTADGQP